jgi:hypothetical protein
MDHDHQRLLIRARRAQDHARELVASAHRAIAKASALETVIAQRRERADESQGRQLPASA